MALWPQVAAQLVTLLPTLPAFSGVPVYDGAPLAGDETPSYVAVGWVLDEDGGGSCSFVQSGDGFHLDETGEVRCEVFAGNGDGDLSAARTAAFALIDAVQAAIGLDRTLGVLPFGSSCDLSVDVVPSQSSSGAGQLLVMSVNYFAPFT